MNSSCPVIVIGAGQAGLVMGYYLKRAGIAHLIIGKEKRIGDVWRNRYDSLALFTPRWMNRLPGGSPFDRLDANGYPDKNEVADMLEAYAEEHLLPVQLDTEVTGLIRDGEGFAIQTSRGTLAASAVVLATGPFQRPHIPDFAKQLSPDVYQVHTAHYRNREQLQAGTVLVVGCGNSGAHIAAELAGHHEVHMSAGGTISFLPQELMGKSIFWWFQRLGLYKAHIDTKIGRMISRRRDPVFGQALKSLIRSGTVKLHPRTLAAQGRQVTFENGAQLQAANVIWATGYRSDYSWVRVPGVLDEHARPSHRRGVSAVRGVYFLGLPWQYNRGSALLGGVASDAEYLLRDIVGVLSR